MKILVNTCYGGFTFNDDFVKALPKFEGLDEIDIRYGNFKRNDINIIKSVEDFGIENVSGSYSSIKIVEIPEESTDWTINEYDGTETVIYVLNGKMHYA